MIPALLAGLSLAACESQGTEAKAAANANTNTVSQVSKTSLAKPASTDDIERFKQAMAKQYPATRVDSISKSPLPGVYEVVIGPQVYYFSNDARYFLIGNMIDMKTKLNLTKPRVQQARLDAVKKIGEDNVLGFAPANPKYTLTVFTDIDCGYCRKMHQQIKQYNDLGIAINYLFYPRAGINSPSYRKAVSVWCADKRLEAFTLAKQGKPIADKQCKHPIKEHMLLVRQMDLNGTPAIIFPDGRLLMSYVPPKELLNILQGKRVR